MKLLQKSYFEKIKIIYIDPPYNTGKDFVYKDDFNDTLKAYKEQLNNITTNTNTDGRFHSNWLNMMYPRLKLAKNLLRDDGVIFISIDDNEAAQLKLLCDEIFGQNNFISQFVWQKKSGGGQAKYFYEGHEYILIYVKNKNLFDGLFKSKDKPEIIDDLIRKVHGKYTNHPKLEPLFDKYGSRLIKHRNLMFEELDIFLNEQMITKEKYNEILENINNKTYFLKQYKDTNFNLICAYNNSDVSKMYSLINGYWTSDGNDEVEQLFKKLVFENPKPTRLLLELFSKNLQKDDIILDFFSGSATTAHAVMQLNAEDGGNRKYILVQVPEPTDTKSIAYQNGYKNICEIGLARIKKSSEKIKQDYKDASFDDGVKVFYLDSSNISEWSGENITQENLFTRLEKIKQDRSELDLVYEFILKQGYSLTSKIEYKYNKYFIKDYEKTMIICLKECDIDELLKYKDCEIIIKDDLLNDDKKLNALENLNNIRTF
ncbi:site-specific DNA-methyltransferase [Campylobacter sp. MG1]|uniref:site-specific DNA-methyltransferase n=1 Tax=Campylobacter sp. MG1 TaxID=2976332 RepID=UPI00226D2F11|nr:site-specific DNA-methyltransferase [Campylobacter sp. MG1]